MGKGALVFKGDEKPKKKKKKVKYGSISQEEVSQKEHEETTHPVEVTSVAATAGATVEPPKIQQGKGLVTTSGTVVMGHNGTQFTRQIRVGDALLVGQEMRVVTMCLSDISLNLSSAFSKNLQQPTTYQFIHKPRSGSTKLSEAEKRQLEDLEASKHASGTYSSDHQLVYREKTEHGSYRIKTQTVQGDVSRGDLLEMRTKKKSDKYC